MAKGSFARGAACTLAGAVLWGFSGACIQQLTSMYDAQPLFITMMRTLGAGVIIVAWLATQMGTVKIPGTGFAISGAVWALLFGVLATTIAFLDVNSLNKANSYGIIMFALMMYVFDGLKTATPAMLGSVIGPMIILIVIGVAGMAIFEFVAVDFPLALANGLTALYGFPPNAIITENTCKALGETKEEFDYLMSETYPSMIVGGFTTVTITSVIIAGIFANLF